MKLLLYLSLAQSSIHPAHKNGIKCTLYSKECLFLIGDVRGVAGGELRARSQAGSRVVIKIENDFFPICLLSKGNTQMSTPD